MQIFRKIIGVSNPGHLVYNIYVIVCLFQAVKLNAIKQKLFASENICDWATYPFLIPYKTFVIIVLVKELKDWVHSYNCLVIR